MLTQEGTSNTPGHTAVTNAEPKKLIGEKKFQEIFEIANSTKNQLCPVRDIISRISDKWSLLAIYGLGGFGTMRFNELKHKIGDISQRMLTMTLRNLEADGLITRTIYAEVPPRVEYSLTELGYSLMEQLQFLTNWANTHSEEIIYFRSKVKGPSRAKV